MAILCRTPGVVEYVGGQAAVDTIGFQISDRVDIAVIDYDLRLKFVHLEAPQAFCL